MRLGYLSLFLLSLALAAWGAVTPREPVPSTLLTGVSMCIVPAGKAVAVAGWAEEAAPAAGLRSPNSLTEGDMMKLSYASAYALQALIHMAALKDNPIVASHHVAQARGIPERFLLKVLKPLVAVGVLQSLKGPNGGYRLARPGKAVTLLEVVEAEDGPVRGLVPEIAGGERLNRRLAEVCDAAADVTRKALAKVRLADLVG
jgi:Rrf2 family protein